MKPIQKLITQFFRQNRKTAQSTIIKADRLKQRILPNRYVEEDDGSLFI